VQIPQVALLAPSANAVVNTIGGQRAAIGVCLCFGRGGGVEELVIWMLDAGCSRCKVLHVAGRNLLFRGSNYEEYQQVASATASMAYDAWLGFGFLCGKLRR